MYVTPINNPFGPKQAINKERMAVTHLGSSCFVVTTTCVTEGVPFSSNFVNRVQWVGVADGPRACRVEVSGECLFHKPVWGPLRGKIEGESSKASVRGILFCVCVLGGGVGWRGAWDGSLHHRRRLRWGQHGMR